MPAGREVKQFNVYLPPDLISEQHGGTLQTHPILGIADAEAFEPDRTPDFAMPFTP